MRWHPRDRQFERVGPNSEQCCAVWQLAQSLLRFELFPLRTQAVVRNAAAEVGETTNLLQKSRDDLV